MAKTEQRNPFSPPLQCVCVWCGGVFLIADYPFYTDDQFRDVCAACALAPTPRDE